MAEKSELTIGRRVEGNVQGKIRQGKIVPVPEGEEGEGFAPWHIAVLWDCNTTKVYPHHPRDLKAL